ncbi:ComEA family DNA-binding protein [Thiovibrio frasassiensis]|uniref:Helix-hairpin-helix domain-containing protein n=1 Tax=Thiovibrio frasassiensis TaxID=2984131 RepID=A0A9X4RM53_9BACT|nr:helix-hairpin-helix domain-containing protein [Thiovibrio frasassiensis]MDG4476781.1 helix-hairpin-helix domain-containing protein [Thiovibrio frasassiensis]
MNRTENDPKRKDLRPMVLVLFAVGILSVTALRTGWLANRCEEPAPAPQSLAWRTGPGTPGLYRVEAHSPSGEEPLPTAPTPARLAPLFFKPIPINQADEELLTTISGIGPVFARRIIAFRNQQGRINAIEELDSVEGVGPAKLKILKANLVVD